MATKQETFDTIVAHLRKQGRKSLRKSRYGDGEIGAYRGCDGAMCAVGVLIPDQQYDPNMEGSSVDASNGEVADLLRSLGHDVVLCDRMQIVHDAYHPPQWEDRFSYVAAICGLTYTPPN